ncbi:MAG: hypothetical protein SF028_00990 [Candidatus Sumerlaeia bacterium]|nr:hypothetical protein [Candidatus Sumerlaeia bacterium]
MKRIALLIALAAALAAAPQFIPAGPGHDHDHGHEDDHDHSKDKRTKLATATIGEWKVTPVALGAVEPGKEVDMDFELAGPAAYPKALRAWIGDETAEKTGKTRIDQAGERRGHGHLAVPKELGEKDLLWIEVEDAKTGKKSRASVPLVPEETKADRDHGQDHDGDHEGHDHEGHDHDGEGEKPPAKK